MEAKRIHREKEKARYCQLLKEIENLYCMIPGHKQNIPRKVIQLRESLLYIRYLTFCCQIMENTDSEKFSPYEKELFNVQEHVDTELEFPLGNWQQFSNREKITKKPNIVFLKNSSSSTEEDDAKEVEISLSNKEAAQVETENPTLVKDHKKDSDKKNSCNTLTCNKDPPTEISLSDKDAPQVKIEDPTLVTDHKIDSVEQNTCETITCNKAPPHQEDECVLQCKCCKSFYDDDNNLVFVVPLYDSSSGSKIANGAAEVIVQNEPDQAESHGHKSVDLEELMTACNVSSKN